MTLRTSSIVALLILSSTCASVGWAQGTGAAQGGTAAQGTAGAQANAGTQDNGTDPSVFAKRMVVYNDFNHLRNGIDVNVNYFDLYFPGLKDAKEVERFLLKVEMPFVNAQNNLGRLLPPAEASEAPPAVSGVGDILFRFFILPWYNESRDFKILTGVDLYIPSAQGELLFSPLTNGFSELQLGTGKYRLAPLLGFVRAVKPNFLIAPIYFQDVSVAGDPSRPNINIGKFRFFVMYAWPSGWYVLPELQIVTNYHAIPNTIIDRFTEVFLRPEVGKVLNKDGTTVYVEPGFGLRNSSPVNRKWGIEAGLRMRY
jgi:hypothetical protein